MNRLPSKLSKRQHFRNFVDKHQKATTQVRSFCELSTTNHLTYCKYQTFVKSLKIQLFSSCSQLEKRGMSSHLNLQKTTEPRSNLMFLTNDEIKNEMKCLENDLGKAIVDICSIKEERSGAHLLEKFQGVDPYEDVLNRVNVLSQECCSRLKSSTQLRRREIHGESAHHHLFYLEDILNFVEPWLPVHFKYNFLIQKWSDHDAEKKKGMRKMYYDFVFQSTFAIGCVQNAKRHFSNIDASQFTRLMIVIRAANIMNKGGEFNNEFHRYYVIYKFYDIFHQFTLEELEIVLRTFNAKSLRTFRKHPVQLSIIDLLLKKLKEEYEQKTDTTLSNCGNIFQYLRKTFPATIDVANLDSDDDEFDVSQITLKIQTSLHAFVNAILSKESNKDSIDIHGLLILHSLLSKSPKGADLSSTFTSYLRSLLLSEYLPTTKTTEDLTVNRVADSQFQMSIFIAASSLLITEAVADDKTFASEENKLLGERLLFCMSHYALNNMQKIDMSSLVRAFTYLTLTGNTDFHLFEKLFVQNAYFFNVFNGEVRVSPALRYSRHSSHTSMFNQLHLVCQYYKNKCSAPSDAKAVRHVEINGKVGKYSYDSLAQQFLFELKINEPPVITATQLLKFMETWMSKQEECLPNPINEPPSLQRLVPHWSAMDLVMNWDLETNGDDFSEDGRLRLAICLISRYSSNEIYKRVSKDFKQFMEQELKEMNVFGYVVDLDYVCTLNDTKKDELIIDILSDFSSMLACKNEIKKGGLSFDFFSPNVKNDNDKAFEFVDKDQIL